MVRLVLLGCYWDVSVVTSLVQSVLHELHPDDIVTFKVIHGEYTIKENTFFQLKPNVKFIIVVTLGLRQAMSISLTL